MKPARLKTHDPLFREALGLVRRVIKSGSFTKSDVERWKAELGEMVVDGLIEEFAPKKAAKAATSKKAGSTAEPDKES